jgi:hypothetical protein
MNRISAFLFYARYCGDSDSDKHETLHASTLFFFFMFFFPLRNEVIYIFIPSSKIEKKCKHFLSLGSLNAKQTHKARWLLIIDSNVSVPPPPHLTRTPSLSLCHALASSPIRPFIAISLTSLSSTSPSQILLLILQSLILLVFLVWRN